MFSESRIASREGRAAFGGECAGSARYAQLNDLDLSGVRLPSGISCYAVGTVFLAALLVVVRLVSAG